MPSGKKGKYKLIKCLSAAVVLLAAISVCLASYTMSRYTTSGVGDGQADVLLWNVTLTPQTNTTIPSTNYDSAISFGKLSTSNSSMATDKIGYLKYKESAEKTLVTLKYQTEVDLNFTATIANYDITYTNYSYVNGNSETIDVATSVTNSATSVRSNSNITDTSGGKQGNQISYKVSDNTNEENLKNAPTLDDLKTFFALDIYCTVGDDTLLTSTDNVYTKGFEKSTDASCIFYGKLVCSIKKPTDSSEAGYDSTGNYYWASYLCDWVGKYVESVSFDITYSARQAE